MQVYRNKKLVKKISKNQYLKQYNKLIKEAESLPRIEAINKLKEASKLKNKFYKR
jgi:hypothetical protein